MEVPSKLRKRLNVPQRNPDKLTITPNCFFSVPIILVGNKSDLQSDRRVTSDEGKNLAAEMKAVFLETSAKENQVNTIE